MPTVPLPDKPSLEQLRKQAKDLRRAVQAADPGVLAEVAERYPDAPLDGAAPFPLRAAELVVARRYGFTSWARLKRHVEVVGHYSRFPDRIQAAGPGSLADEFLCLACLSYEDDQPGQWSEARQLLVKNPGLTHGSVHVAAAAADIVALRRLLDADPAAARREGGPYQVEPLFYLAYARHDPAIAAEAVLGAAAAPGRWCRPERRLPLARAAHPVHGAHRGLRRG